MADHVLKVRNRTLYCDNPTVIANGVNCDTISLDLDEEWTAYDKIILILGKEGSAVAAEYDGTPLNIPPYFLSKTGYIPLSVVGQNETQRITTSACPTLLYVRRSGLVMGGA